MRDPLTWSLSLGRWIGGITVRVHILFFLFTAYQLYSFHHYGEFRLGLCIMAILWLSVLLHEYGHCFAAQWVGGHAEEIVMWPLGGLAFVEVGNNPRAQWIATAGGPAVNLMLCLVTVPALLVSGDGVPLNPLNPPYALYGESLLGSVLAGTFWLNWILLIINLLPGFPLDGGRLLRCWLWSRQGFGRATLHTVQVAKVTAIALGLLGLLGSVGAEKAWSDWTFLLLGLAVVIYIVSERERQLLESGLLFDDSVFGYDFSQGYTSLEKSSASLQEREPGFWQRWKARRAQLRREREQARMREEERRVDEILARIAEHGIESISDADRRFLNRASARYRSRDR
jgi:stage IV sporulation protein FB